MHEFTANLLKRLPLYTFCGIGQTSKFTALVSFICGFEAGYTEATHGLVPPRLLPKDLIARVAEFYHIPIESMAQALNEIIEREGCEEKAFLRLRELLEDETKPGAKPQP